MGKKHRKKSSIQHQDAQTGPTKTAVSLWGLAIVGVATVSAVMLTSESDAGGMVVYKDPNCGCCGKWVEHMKATGYEVEVRNRRDLNPIKAEQGVPMGMRSCHTAVVDGYFIEGHVPAEDVTKLLTEKPAVKGLAVPGMPLGSPGMEVPGREPMRYSVYAIGQDGKTTAFANH